MTEIFNKQALAEFLRVDLKTINYLANMKRLPYFKVGREVRFLRSSVEEWAKNNEIYPEKC